MQERPNNDWHLQQWRAPTLGPEDELIFDEPGRIMRKTDFRSHWFRLVKPRYGEFTLLVSHGAGQERVVIDYSSQLVEALRPLPSDERYYLLHTFLKVFHAARDSGAKQAAEKYRAAFLDGRLKKRKVRGRSGAKVWIEPAAAQ